MKRDPSEPENVIKALQESWKAEVESARAYRELAETEKDDRRKQILLRMAEGEERHAARFEERLTAEGAAPPVLQETLASRWNRLLSRTMGTDAALRRMEAVEDRQASRFAAQRAAALGHDEEAAKVLYEMEMEEKAHSKMIQQMVPELGARTALDYMMKKERWHGRGGSWVADAIYGVNDGLGAVFGIVSGVAGATENAQHTILISGLAAMLASALSMGSGAYLAVKSQREVHEAEMAREERELAEDPEEEIEEMALFYQLQGFDEEQSHSMARRLAEDPGRMLTAMAQAELGLSSDRLPNPLVSASSAAISTAVGAFIPIIPFFSWTGWTAVIIAAIVSLIAHFAVGAAKTLITTRSWWASGSEMMLVGAAEGIITYGLGLVFGGHA